MNFVIDKPIRLIELFAGVGSQAMALRDIGANFEHYRVVEFDKYPVASYNAIHGTNFPTMDVTKIHGSDLGITEVDKFTYVLTYSFPCQDLSVAGKGKGMTKGSGTRSGLLWEVERLLNETENLPQILIMENVPQVHSKKNMPDFQNWLDYLSSRGYKTYWQDLNAMQYGVAQSRNRCIAVSILGDFDFEFPKPIPLDKVMKDYLKESVDEKYYLTSDKAKELIDKLILDGKITTGMGHTASVTLYNMGSSDTERKSDAKFTDVSPTLCPETTRDLATMEAAESLSVQELGFIEKGTGKHQSNTVYGSDGLCPTITAVSWKAPLKVTQCHKIEVIGRMDNTVDHTYESANRVYGLGGLAPAIPTMQGGGQQPKVMEIQRIVYDDYNSCVRADQNTINAITTNCGASALRNCVKIIESVNVKALRMVRTEEGKQLRKAYEAGEIHHGYNEHREAEPREDGCCNTLTTVQKDNLLLETVKVKQATQSGYVECIIGGVADLSFPDSKTRRGRVIENGEICPTLMTGSIPNVLEKFIYEIDGETYLIRIRKLTPRECWRLMGFTDEDFDKAASVNSNTQLYKQAGNSIVKQVLMQVLSQLIHPKDGIQNYSYNKVHISSKEIYKEEELF